MKRRPDKPEAFRFVISHSFTKESLPLRRLAEYLRHIAALLGESEHVHFDRLENGSVAIVQRIDPPAVPKVRERLSRLRGLDVPDDLASPRKELDELLAGDDAKGALFEGKRKLADFEGRDMPKRIGPVEQEGQLDGILISIGGTGTLVWADLKNEGAVYHCTMDVETAKRLAPHLYGETLRVFGQAIWYREPVAGWTLERLRVGRFETLSDEPLQQTVATLRKIKGSGWDEIEDPIAELHRIRHGRN